jgi:hypothetical protein
MYQYRQILVRMRRGDSDRDIARSKTMGRKKIAQVREIAAKNGWLAREAALPDEHVMAAFLDRKEAPLRIELRLNLGTVARADHQVAGNRRSMHHDPRHARSQPRIQRQLFLGLSFPSAYRRFARSRRAAAPGVQARGVIASLRLLR